MMEGTKFAVALRGLRFARHLRVTATKRIVMMTQLEQLDSYIDAVGNALALPIEAAWKPAVRANLEITLRLARLVDEFPLPDESEPAPVFSA